MDIWTVVHIVHLLAMAFFIGGQIMLAAVLVPILRGREELRVAARRFAVGSLIALGLLVITGVELASHGDWWGDGVFHAKLTLLVLLVAAMGYHIHNAEKRWLDPVIGVLSLAVMMLGVVLAH